MTTYYIDPTASTNGSGTISSPYNTWSGISFVDGNTYLQKAGTTYNGVLTINANNIYIGYYGNNVGMNGNYVIDKPKINGNGYNRGITISGNVSNVIIDNFEIYGANNRTPGTVRGIAVGSTTTALANNCTVSNCIIRDIFYPSPTDDANGISVFGNDFKLLNCNIYNISDDGVWLCGNNIEVGYCNIYNVAQSTNIAGDCIQFNNTAGQSSNYWIHHCTLDHSSIEMKQCFIDAVGYGGSIGGIFENNVCIMGTDNFQADTSKTVNIGNPGAIIRNNLVQNGWAGIWIVGNNVNVNSNLILGSKRGGAVISGTLSGINIYNNTIYSTRIDKIASSRAIEISSTTVTANSYNNIISGTGFDYGIACSKTSATSNGISIKNNKGLVNINIQSVNGGIDSSNVSTNPILDSNYTPSPSSPCIGTGYKYWSTNNRPVSYNGESLPDTHIDIGAIQTTYDNFHPINL